MTSTATHEDPANRLSATVSAGLIHYLRDFQKQIQKLLHQVPEEKLWFRPYPYGNSLGNLVSHITGNVENYIGAQIAHTSYVRDRPYEFARARHDSREEILAKFDAAIERFVTVVQQQSITDWSLPFQDAGLADVHNRFDILLRCTMHIHHHLGQMIYLRKAILGEIDP